jgi:hypothetical protein
MHKAGRAVEIGIKDDQNAALSGVFDEAQAAANVQQPGIVFAQVFTRYAKVCFISEPWASEIKATLSRRAAALFAASKEAA